MIEFVTFKVLFLLLRVIGKPLPSKSKMYLEAGNRNQ